MEEKQQDKKVKQFELRDLMPYVSLVLLIVTIILAILFPRKVEVQVPVEVPGETEYIEIEVEVPGETQYIEVPREKTAHEILSEGFFNAMTKTNVKYERTFDDGNEEKYESYHEILTYNEEIFYSDEVKLHISDGTKEFWIEYSYPEGRYAFVYSNINDCYYYFNPNNSSGHENFEELIKWKLRDFSYIINRFPYDDPRFNETMGIMKYIFIDFNKTLSLDYSLEVQKTDTNYIITQTFADSDKVYVYEIDKQTMTLNKITETENETTIVMNFSFGEEINIPENFADTSEFDDIFYER